MRTERLLLEPLRPDHAEEMVEPLSSPTLYGFIGGTAPTRTDLYRLYMRQSVGSSPSGDAAWLNWIVRETEQAQAIGYVQATITMVDGHRLADLAWVVDPSHQRQGFATEASAAMVDWLVRRDVGRLGAAIHPDNIASTRVAERLGLHPSEEVDDGEVVWCRLLTR